MRFGFAGVASIALLLAAGPAQAIFIGFECLTGNDATDCMTGELQLDVEVTDQGGGVVRFHFRNAGPEPSSISEVYFDDGSLLALSSVIDGPGVDFEPNANPPDLPGGQMAIPPFQVTEGFLAESVPSPVQNGVGPSQWVMIHFTLQAGRDYDDVIEDLTTGDLRIGIHVIGFGDDGSESFINPPVPEPGTGLLVGGGLVALLLRRPGRRRERQARRTTDPGQ